MNSALVSPRFLLPVLVAALGHGAGFTALALLAKWPLAPWRLALFALAFSFLGCFMHEKVVRCWSPLWERALRFGTFWFVVVVAPMAALGVAPPTSFRADASFGLLALLVGGGWAVSVLGFAWPIHLLYRLDPKGNCLYFSVSGKFARDPRARADASAASSES